jgi:protein-tyrosine phosphatase
MVFGRRKTYEPNFIDTVQVPGYTGAMGLVACPGTRLMKPELPAKKLLPVDLDAAADWGANGLVCLLEHHELSMHRIENLGEEAEARGMWYKHLPIADMNVPTQDFEDEWAIEGERIRHALRIGERVVFHCYAGLGRTGMMAARILVEMGMPPEEAIAEVRRSNPKRIQTKGQSNYVRRCYSLVE